MEIEDDDRIPINKAELGLPFLLFLSLYDFSFVKFYNLVGEKNSFRISRLCKEENVKTNIFQF